MCHYIGSFFRETFLSMMGLFTSVVGSKDRVSSIRERRMTFSVIIFFYVKHPPFFHFLFHSPICVLLGSVQINVSIIEGLVVDRDY